MFKNNLSHTARVVDGWVKHLIWLNQRNRGDSTSNWHVTRAKTTQDDASTVQRPPSPLKFNPGFRRPSKSYSRIYAVGMGKGSLGQRIVS